MAPHYDLLSTAAYRTRAIAEDRARWPDVEMAFPLPGAKTFGEITRTALIEAGRGLGLGTNTAARIVREVVERIPPAFDRIKGDLLAAAGAMDIRLVGAIEFIILRDTLARITAS